MTIDDVLYRRLSLSKHFYLHGLKHSDIKGAFDKIMAIHNFHIAVEISLRAIILKYCIRGEKQINIDFETMLSQIDSHDEMKAKGLRLPLRQELRQLNTLRNLVQHHVTEPPDSAVEEWRVLTRQFLVRISAEYFSIDYETLSLTQLVNDEHLRSLLLLSKELIGKSQWKLSTIVSKIAFTYAVDGIVSSIPRQTDFSFSRGFRDSQESTELVSAINQLNDRIHQVEVMAALLSSGVKISEYNRYHNSSPHVSITMSGKPYIVIHRDYEEEEVKWGEQYVLDSILAWQNQGIGIGLRKEDKEEISKYVAEIRVEIGEQIS